MDAEQGLVAVGNVVGLTLLGHGALVGLVPGLLAGQGLCLLVESGLNDVSLLYQPLPIVLQTFLKGRRREWN